MLRRIQLALNHPWVFLLIIAGVGMILDLIVIRNGVGASGDAEWYMQGAENILKGYGYGLLVGKEFIPTSMFPPFYSIFLAGLGLFGITIFHLAGIMNTLLLGTNIILTGWIILKLTGSIPASIIASTFTLLRFDLFVLHTWAMSEPLYLTLTLFCFLSFYSYQKKGQTRYLVLAGLLAGLSVITRYVGISLAATLCIWTLFFGLGSMKKRWLDGAILLTLCLVPVALFFIRNAVISDTISGRSALVFHAIPIENYIDLMQTLSSWYFPMILSSVPYFFKKVVFIALLFLSLILFIFSIRYPSTRKVKDQPLFTYFEFLFLIFLILYGLTFMGSIHFSLIGGPIQISRYLTAIFPVFLLLAVLIFLRVQRALSSKGIFYGGVGIGLVIVILALYIYNFSSLYKGGVYLGYTEIRNEFPELINELESIDRAQPIIASNYELISFLVDRPVHSMPGEGDELTGIANPNFPQLLKRITDLIDKGAILAVYRSTPDETFHYDSLINDMTILHTYGNGWISITLYTTPRVDK
jgi:4-amino-4-deoxy-L-arabinose transferase-like glycosyltransferase